jgi:phi13 family phage major tail protein
MPISVNANEYKSVVGVSELYVAEVTQDDSSAYTADTPEYLAPAAEVTHEPSVNLKPQYADDQPFDTMSSEGETTISLTVTGIPIEMLAKITGRVFDTASGRMFDNGGVPPYFALMFRSQKSNGSYRYYSYLKGRFDMPSEEAVTKADSPDPKTVKLTFIAIKTVYAFDLGDIDDGVKQIGRAHV